jgi:hypothetical protein
MSTKYSLKLVRVLAMIFLFIVAYSVPTFSQGGADRSVGDHEKPGKDSDKDKGKDKDRSNDKSGGNAEKSGGFGGFSLGVSEKNGFGRVEVGGFKGYSLGVSEKNGLGRAEVGGFKGYSLGGTDKFDRAYEKPSREHALNYHPSDFEPQRGQTNSKSGYDNAINKLEGYVDKYTGWSPSQNSRIGVDRKQGIIGIRVGPPSSVKQEKIKEVELPPNHCKSKGTPPPLDNLPPGSAQTGGN